MPSERLVDERPHECAKAAEPEVAPLSAMGRFEEPIGGSGLVGRWPAVHLFVPVAESREIAVGYQIIHQPEYL